MASRTILDLPLKSDSLILLSSKMSHVFSCSTCERRRRPEMSFSIFFNVFYFLRRSFPETRQGENASEDIAANESATLIFFNCLGLMFDVMIVVFLSPTLDLIR